MTRRGISHVGRKRRPLLPMAVLSTVLSVTVAGCGAGSPGDQTGGGDGSLKIGVVGPMSGPASAWGLALRGGVELAAEEVNEAGGVTIDGTEHEVEVIVYDDQYQGGKAVTATNRLISQDQVDYIIGPIGSDSLLAMRPITEDAQVVMLANSLTPAALTAETTYTFRTILSPSEYTPGMYEWIAENHPQIQSVALVTPNDEGGRGVTEVAEAALKDENLTFHTEYYERGTQDFTTVVSQLLAQQPDAVDLAGSPPGDAATIVRQLRASGFDGRLIKSGGSAVQQIVDVAGSEAAEGFLFYSDVNFAAPAIQEYAERFDSEYNADLNSLSPWFHDGTLFLLEAIEEAGTRDTEVVAETLESMTFEGPLVGTMRWGGEDRYGIAHQVQGPWYLMEWRNGAVEVAAELQAS